MSHNSRLAARQAFDSIHSFITMNGWMNQCASAALSAMLLLLSWFMNFMPLAMNKFNEIKLIQLRRYLRSFHAWTIQSNSFFHSMSDVPRHITHFYEIHVWIEWKKLKHSWPHSFFEWMMRLHESIKQLVIHSIGKYTAHSCGIYHSLFTSLKYSIIFFLL